MKSTCRTAKSMCIRVMLLVNTEKRQDEIQNIYLRGAANLRQRNVEDD